MRYDTNVTVQRSICYSDVDTLYTIVHLILPNLDET